MCGKSCDLARHGCESNGTHLNYELALKAKDAISKCEFLMLHGIGEPLTCPYLFEIASWAPESAHTEFCTNGRLLHAENISRIFKANIKSVDISLDAASSDVYRAIRHGDFIGVLGNIYSLICRRNDIGRAYPEVFMNMTLMRRNVKDVPAFVLLSKALGVNGCYVAHMNDGLDYRIGDWFDYKSQHCSNAPDEHDAAIREAKALANLFGVKFTVKGKMYLKE